MKDCNENEMTQNDIELIIQDFDQGVTSVLRTIPGFLWSFFSSLKTQGFSDTQAMDLTKEYMREKL